MRRPKDRHLGLERAMPWLVAAGGALVAWLIAGTGFVNYDTAYTLVWGTDVAHGRAPDFSVPVAPTPHPLATVVAALLSPLGDAAATVWVVGAFAALGALAGLTYVIAARWLGMAGGVLAAAIVVTREPVLSFGARAYVDIPYLVLVLAALAMEARRPRAGPPVLIALALAGLLRPEAWLFSLAYLAYLWWGGRREWRLVALAASAPVLWLATDWLLAGDPLHSLTGTRDNAQVLQRRTGLDEVPVTVPRRLGEILREDVLLGAALGGILSLAFLRGRAKLTAIAGGVAMAAFCVLAAAGLPVIGRYLLAPATLLAVFCAAGVLGWRRLPPGHPWRRRWQIGAALVGVAFLAFLPAHVNRLERLHAALGAQKAIQDDLHALAPVLRARCAPVGVPNHRLVPLLAFWLDRPPAQIVSAQLRELARGQYVDPANATVERRFTLDKNDPKRLTARVPPDFRPAGGNASWRLYERC